MEKYEEIIRRMAKENAENLKAYVCDCLCKYPAVDGYPYKNIEEACAKCRVDKIEEVY